MRKFYNHLLNLNQGGFKLMILIVLVSLCWEAKSQTYFDFQNQIPVTTSPPSPTCRPFQDGKFSTYRSGNSPWQASHGTPELANPYQQNFYNYARLRTSQSTTSTALLSEGLYIPYPFKTTNLYTVNVLLRIDEGVIGISVNIANGLTAATTATCVEEAFPTGKDRQEIKNELLSTDYVGDFKTYTTDKFQLKDKDYAYLWISSDAVSTATANFIIAQVSITDNGPVPAIIDNKICCDQTIVSGQLRATLNQTSGTTLSGDLGDILLNGNRVRME